LDSSAFWPSVEFAIVGVVPVWGFEESMPLVISVVPILGVGGIDSELPIRLLVGAAFSSSTVAKWASWSRADIPEGDPTGGVGADIGVDRSKVGISKEGSIGREGGDIGLNISKGDIPADGSADSKGGDIGVDGSRGDVSMDWLIVVGGDIGVDGSRIDVSIGWIIGVGGDIGRDIGTGVPKTGVPENKLTEGEDDSGTSTSIDGSSRATDTISFPSPISMSPTQIASWNTTGVMS
jgi:hypothetical protein